MLSKKKIELQIGSVIYPYWKTVSISKRIDAVASSFDLTVFGLYASDFDKIPIKVGNKAGVKLEGIQVVSGYIDKKTASFSKSDHSIAISGRDNTGDLVDCSIIEGPTQFQNQTLTQIAQRLCNPFGIPVISSAGDIIKSFKIDPGESIFEALERYARIYGYLLRPDGLGNLTIPGIGSTYANSALIQGKNIISASVEYDHSDRFNEYKVFGQNQLPDEEEEGSEEVTGSAKDNGVLRYRPKAIISNNSINDNQAKALAEWEATVRAARAISVTIEVQDWKQGENRLWDVNELVRVESPSLGVSAYMLSTGVDFTYSKEEGKKTSIELTRLDAFKPSPVIDEVEFA